MLESIKCSTGGAYYVRGAWVNADADAPAALAAQGFDAAAVADAPKGTMAYGILTAHNTSGSDRDLRIKFDAMASHDITFVGIIQTARASGLEKFPIPYVLTNFHNSLCAVGGTINEDDHRFGLSAAKKYGGIFVPPHMAVIQQYMRERFAGCGKMILGSDSHTRYGALGTMAIGEGGGELAKQLLGRTYDVARPGVVAISLTGSLPAGCGPHDVAIALVGKLFKSGYVKNKVMEFVGPGVASLRQDTRNAIDAMTTETTCLSSIWETDETTQKFLAVHGRAADYKKLAPADLAYYDGVVEVDLSAIRPMIALPMHPSNAFTIEELNANLEDILHACEQDVQKLIGRKDVSLDLCSKIENGKLRVDQGVIAGCAGGLFDSIYEAASILKGHTGGCGDYALSVYPGSQPIMMELTIGEALSHIYIGNVDKADGMEAGMFPLTRLEACMTVALEEAKKEILTRPDERYSVYRMEFDTVKDLRYDMVIGTSCSKPTVLPLSASGMISISSSNTKSKDLEGVIPLSGKERIFISSLSIISISSSELSSSLSSESLFDLSSIKNVTISDQYPYSSPFIDLIRK